MVHIETVDLSSRNVTLPSDRVGMVIVQPHLSLTAVEPYRCTALAKPQQLAMLSKTLEVARAARHGAPKTHFTVFPEYSIPEPEGIALVETTLQATDWQNGTIVIGGTDALSKSEFATLLNAPGSHFDLTHNGLDLRLMLLCHRLQPIRPDIQSLNQFERLVLF